MFGGMSQSKFRNKVGLDIGNHSIKIIEIAETQDKPILVGYGIRKIAGTPKDKLADIIKILAEESKVGTKDVNVSVSGPSVIIRLISMPKMGDEELKSAIRFEAEKFLPFNINDCILDFQTLKKDEKESKLNILLVCAKKDIVQDRIKLIEDAGLSVAIMDVDSFALTNSFHRNFPDISPEKSNALLNIGAASTNLTITRAGVVSLVRDVAIGGNDINAVIAKKTGLGPNESEEIKHAPKDKAQEIISSVKPVLINLFDDIKLSFGYYENQSGRGVDDIYISGGSAELISFKEVFQESFGFVPKIWNPLQFINVAVEGQAAVDIDRVKNSFAIAAGLALR